LKNIKSKIFGLFANVEIDKDLTIDRLQDKYDAVIAVGKPLPSTNKK
jgi:NADPH-dependent glutamate synthase beta subunit-like oxidoreductase